MASTVLSQTLRSITLTKIKELEKQRSSFNERKTALLNVVDQQSSAHERLSTLLNGLYDFRDLFYHQQGEEVSAARRCLEQSAYDPAIRHDKLLSIERMLRGKLDAGYEKLELAHLHSRLLTEWIEKPAKETIEADSSDSGSDESFEILQDTQKQRLEQLREKFARVVFEPLETDEVEIDNYLRSLFDGDVGDNALKQLREAVSNTSRNMLEDNFRLDDQSLRWCVKALLKNDMLNDEKKATLREFLKDEAVLCEIRDVLNMRIRDIKTWDWDRGGVGMPVMPRQSLNGKWRVMMDEDVLQALLTHWIGTYWAVSIKKTLQSLQAWKNFWKQGSCIPEHVKEKYSYFLESTGRGFVNGNLSVERERLKNYQEHFFMSPLPSKLFEEAGGYDDEDDDVPEADADKLSAKDVKQLLLRTLATEVIMRRSFDGEVAVVQSDFQWFATGMPHSTIFAVLRFLGFSEEWLIFFQKALSPPMDMLDGQAPRQRKRGLPMAHIFEKLIGELVLFFLDLDVSQNSGMLLYRFHDDLWLAGQPSKCAAAWQSMEKFATVMGLEFNWNKTGSAYMTFGRPRNPAIEKALPTGPVGMYFLNLDPLTGQWTIAQEHVQKHVEQLQKQLNECRSVLQWIKTWNSCIGRFFSYTFGEPAACFGPDHVRSVLQTHKTMQRFLFNGENGSADTVVEHLKTMIGTRFQSILPPDSFILMPESLGGLGLQNPFISLLLFRNTLNDSPETTMLKHLREERRLYELDKRNFENLSEKSRRKRYKSVFIEDDDKDATPSLSWDQAQDFLSFEEYTAYREVICSQLHATYQHLMKPARPERITAGQTVTSALENLKFPEGLDVRDHATLNREALWTVLSLQGELFERFGGLEVVDRSLLPLGVLKAMKEKRVTWQMVL